MRLIKSFFKKLVDGAIYGTGFLLFYGIIAVAGLFVVGDVSLYQVKGKLVDMGVVPAAPPQVPDPFPTTVKKRFTSPPVPIPTGYEVVGVASQDELSQAIRKIKDNTTGVAIVLQPGEYTLGGTVYINDDRVHITSSTGNPYDVTIRGRKGRFKGSALFRVSADYFTIDGVTLSDSPNHLIQVAGESNASYTTINNAILQDSYEQLVKVSYNKNTKPNNFSVGGVVTNSIFQYTDGIAPNYYTGGIDALGSIDWRVENNVFRDLASPKDRISQHAVHFWVNSENTQVLNNLFVDNDRAIGFGMPLPKNSNILKYSHKGGVISGNVIFHSDNGDPFGDTGIVLEASEDAAVKDNLVYMEHDYPRAIEYRFPQTSGLIIENNLTNKSIASRDGAKATLIGNSESLGKDEFIARYSEIIAHLGIEEIKEPLEKN